MTDQSSSDNSSPKEAPRQHCRSRGRGALLIVLVALLAGLGGGLLSRAFGHGLGWHHHGFMSGPLSKAEAEDRVDRMTKHLAIELDVNQEQQTKISGIAKAAVEDLWPMREKARAARAQALALLTAPNVDRDAIERLRTEQITLADAASRRIAQALEDTSDSLTPEQRRKIAEWIAAFDGRWGPWHRD